MQTMTIKNKKDNETYTKDFNSVDEAKNWVVNHLDLSKDWKIDQEKKMTKKQKCIDLVNDRYQSRLKEIKKAYDNNNLDVSEWLSEYGLSWDYVVSNTFDNQEEGYYRWQLSWGGPSDEFRIYTDNDKNISNIEYWYLDWFDGASINVNDQEVINMIVWQLECDLTPMEHEAREVA